MEEHDLPYWKGRLIDIEELIYLETDRKTTKALLIGYAKAYTEIQILEIIMSTR